MTCSEKTIRRDIILMPFLQYFIAWWLLTSCSQFWTRQKIKTNIQSLKHVGKHWTIETIRSLCFGVNTDINQRVSTKNVHTHTNINPWNLCSNPNLLIRRVKKENRFPNCSDRLGSAWLTGWLSENILQKLVSVWIASCQQVVNH